MARYAFDDDADRVTAGPNTPICTHLTPYIVKVKLVGYILQSQVVCN